MRKLVVLIGLFGWLPGVMCAQAQLDTVFRVDAGLMVGQNAALWGDLLELVNDDFIDDLEKQKFLSNLPENSRAGFFSSYSVSVPLRGMHLTAGNQQLQAVQFDRDIALLALQGNAHRTNEFWNLGSSGVELNGMSWVGVDKQWHTDRLQLSLGASLYAGQRVFRWRGENSELYTDSTAAYLLLTGGHEWQRSSRNPLAGLGLGLSLEAKWQSQNERWKADLQARHLGGMYWFKGPESGRLMGNDTLEFNGIFIDNIIQWEPEDRELLDSLNNQYTLRDSAAFFQGLNAPLRLSFYRTFSNWAIGVRGEYITQSLMQPRTGILAQWKLRGHSALEAFAYVGGYEPWGIQLAYSFEKADWSGTLHLQQIQSLIPSQRRGGGIWLTLRKKIHP